jgi:fucose permease
MIGGRALIFAAWSGVFIYGYLNAMLGIVLPNLMEKLKLDKTQAGEFFMFSSIGLLVSSVPSGLTMDYSGTKLITCLGLLLVGAAFWGLGSIRSARFLYALAFVLGLGGSMIIAGENTTISLANTGHREVASNLLNLFFGVGAFVAPFIVMPILKHRGFSGVLKTSAILTGAILALHLSLSFPPPVAAAIFPLASVAALIVQPRLLLLMFLVFLYVGTEFSVWSWTVTFLTTERGYAQQSASRIISIFALAMIAGRWTSQWTLIKFGPQLLLLLSAAGAVISLGALYVLRGRAMIILAACAAGWFMAAIFPTALGLAGNFFPSSVGTAISLVTTGGWIGAIAIPPAVGFVADRSGVSRGVLIPVASAFLMIITPILLIRMH